MADPAPGKIEADKAGWFVRDYFPDGVCPLSTILLDAAGSGVGIDFAASSLTTGIDMSSATISGDDIVLSASGVIMAATSIGFEIAGTSKLAITSTGIKLDATVTLDDDGTIADASNVMTITQNTITLAGATKINLDGPTDVTGILTIDTAGSPNDGIKINATTPTDGLEIASACGSHAINISAAQTGAGITLGSTCGTYGLNIAGACSTAGVFLSTTNKISFHDADIYMRASADGHFEIVSDDTITLSATGHGGIVFGGETDWGTGLTGYDIDGTGWDWVTQTVGHVDAGDLATACAASYNALTVTATSHSTASSFFGTWTELYFVAAVDLTNAANAAAVWGQLEGAGALTSPDSGDFIAGGYFNVKTAGQLTLTTGSAVAGVRVQAEINSTTGAGRLSAFECLKSGGADWAYGLYLADMTTGISIGTATKGIHLGSSGGAASATGLLFGIGTSGTPSTSSTGGDKFIELRCETTATSGDNRLQYMRYYMNGINATGGECLKAGTVLGAAIGTARGEQASIEVSSTGYVTGFACGMDALLEVANSAVPSGGTYCAGQSQIYITGASSDLSAAADHSVHRFSVLGGDATAEAKIKNAFNFAVANCAGAGAGNMISVGTNMGTVIGTIRIVINGATQYIPYYGHEGHA